MADFGFPPQFPVEEEVKKEKEESDVFIKDKAKGKKVIHSKSVLLCFRY